MLDLDHFKRVNERYGRPAGDEVLRETARRIRRVIRPADALGRYEGQEFMLVFSSCNQEQAASIAQRISDALHDHPVELADGTLIPVSASLGVHAGCSEHGASDLSAWIESADRGLYRAKQGGRDRIVIDRRWTSEA
jgi:diguanylate cyclase (GGDEF)-like protein